MLNRDRLPGSIQEARLLVAYNEQTLAKEMSPERRHRAEQRLSKLRPLLEALERDEAERLKRIDGARVRRGTDEELDVVWSGGEGLTTMGARRPWMQGL